MNFIKDKINIAIFGGSPNYEAENRFYCVDTFAFFVKKISPYFKNIYYFAPLFYETALNTKKLSSLSAISFEENITLIGTYPSRTLIGFYRRLPFILWNDFAKYKKYILKSDVVFLRIPSVLTIPSFILSVIYKKPIVTYYASDIKRVVSSGYKYKGLIKSLASIVAWMHYLFFKFMIKKSAAAIFLSSELMQSHECKNPFYAFASIVDEKSIVGRDNWNLPRNKIFLLYVGRLTHEKGLVYLLNALPLLVADGMDVKLTICGEGVEGEKLRNITKELGLEKIVKFAGYVQQGEHLDEIFHENDIFVLPSTSEGSPKVLLEAMAKGLAIVASNIGGIPDMIKKNANGQLVEPKSEQAIADGIKKVAYDYNLRNKIVKNAYNYVKEHTAQKQAERIAKILYSVIENTTNNVN